MQTLEEKMRYNRARKNEDIFARGYVFGVNFYRNYPKKAKEDKQHALREVDGFSKLAKRGNKYAKGIMCGFRDASLERKRNQVRRYTSL